MSKDDDSLKWLDQINDCLEIIPKNIGTFFDEFFLSGEEMTQDSVDIVCTWLAWTVNITVEKLRQKAVRTLHDQNSAATKILGPVRFFVEVIKNPLGLLSAAVQVIKRIASHFRGPLDPILRFIKNLTKQIARLVKNLAALQSMVPPDPPSPNIDFHAFSRNLKIGRMGMDIILEDPDKMPSPEEKFPEPYNPFSFKKNKEANMSFWAKATKNGREDFQRLKYDVKVAKETGGDTVL